ncbi:ABC transporter ATP-binding protein [Streptomyces iakyrus]|uniref:ABC transporter ATP-binding protein n=1 Tax=Streptomyces iakyrus TaxID=68219 RepID=UPI003D92988E
MRLHDVRKAYGRRQVLRGVNLEVPQGCLFGIVGANGAGKSTLLRILVGQAAADSGTVQCRGRIGYCPQNTVLHPALTVQEHVRFFQAAYRLDDCRRVWELLEQLRFDECPRSRLHTLSGGTRQKLNLALGLMHDPDVLLLDEPYQGFDWETYLRFWEVATALREGGRTVVVVSHLAYDRDRLDVMHRLEDGVLTVDHSSVAGSAA